MKPDSSSQDWLPDPDRFGAGVNTRSAGMSMASALWLAQLLLTCLAAAHMLLSTLSIASCTETSCDYAAFSASLNIFYAGAVVLLVASAIAIVLLRRRGRVVLLAPTAGILLLFILLAATYVASRAALTLPLFGNRIA